MSETARLADTSEDFRRFSLSPEIEPWEHGMRTNGEAGSFEWLYTQVVLEDGTTLVTTFHTKRTAEADGPLNPYVSVVLDSPSGRHIERKITGPLSVDDKTNYDLRIGNSFLRRWSEPRPDDLNSYLLVIDDERVGVDLELTGRTPAWRPATGHFVFGDNSLGWLATVPHGEVTGTITVDGIDIWGRQPYRGSGRQRDVKGVCYLDHNWGNRYPAELLQSWYWYQGQSGEHVLVAAQLTARPSYGGVDIPVALIAKPTYGQWLNGRLLITGSEIVVEDGRQAKFYRQLGGPAVNDAILYAPSDDTAYLATFSGGRVVAERTRADAGRTGLTQVTEPVPGYRRFVGTMRSYNCTTAGEANIGMFEDTQLG